MTIESVVKAEIAKLEKEKPQGWEEKVDELNGELETLTGDEKYKKFRDNVKKEYSEKATVLKGENEELKKKLSEYQKKEKELSEAEMMKKGEFEKLIEQNKSIIKELDEKVKGYEVKEQERIKRVGERLEKEIASIPEPFRKRIPEFDNPEKKLAWIEENKDILGTSAQRIKSPGGVGANRGQDQSEEPPSLFVGKKSKVRGALTTAIENGDINLSEELQ